MKKSIYLLALFTLISSKVRASNQCDYFLNSLELEQEIFEAEVNNPGSNISEINSNKIELEGLIALLDEIARLPDPNDFPLDDSLIIRDEILNLLEIEANFNFVELFGETEAFIEEDGQNSTDLWLKRRISDLMIRTLTPKEERIIRLRFFSNLDLDKISISFRVTRERIRQIEFHALQKLKRKLINQLDNSRYSRHRRFKF